MPLSFEKVLLRGLKEKKLSEFFRKYFSEFFQTGVRMPLSFPWIGYVVDQATSICFMDVNIHKECLFVPSPVDV